LQRKSSKSEDKEKIKNHVSSALESTNGTIVPHHDIGWYQIYILCHSNLENCITMDSPTKRTLIHLFSLTIQYEQVYRENYEKKTNEDRIINIQRLLRDLLDSQIEYKQIPEHK
jgi:hypothetical protein